MNLTYALNGGFAIVNLSTSQSIAITQKMQNETIGRWGCNNETSSTTPYIIAPRHFITCDETTNSLDQLNLFWTLKGSYGESASFNSYCNQGNYYCTSLNLISNLFGVIPSGSFIYDRDSRSISFDSQTTPPSPKVAYVITRSGHVDVYSYESGDGGLTYINEVFLYRALNTGAIDPAKKHLYVTGTGKIFIIDINQTDNKLIESSVRSIETPSREGVTKMVINPTDTVAYTVIDNGSVDEALIRSYRISESGMLSQIGVYSHLGRPMDMVIDKAGKYAYVVSDKLGVLVYSIDSNGILHPLQSLPTGVYPKALTIDPTGSYLYVLNADNKNISMYNIDNTTGTLKAIQTAPMVTGNSPYDIVIDPTGQYAYVINLVSDNISAYNINSKGVFTPPEIESNFAGYHPIGIAAVRNYIYVINGHSQMLIYSIRPDSSLVLIHSVDTDSTPMSIIFN